MRPRLRADGEYALSGVGTLRIADAAECVYSRGRSRSTLTLLKKALELIIHMDSKCPTDPFNLFPKIIENMNNKSDANRNGSEQTRRPPLD